MPTFQPLQLGDKSWVDEILTYENVRGCDYNFTNMFVWGQSYNQTVARMGDLFLTRFCGRWGCSYTYPVGRGDKKEAIEFLMADANSRNAPLRMMALTPEQGEELEGFFPGQFTLEEDRDAWDYLYDINRLVELGGKKLHAKRNHINRFGETYPDWTFEPMTVENIPDCLEMDEQWYQQAKERLEEEDAASLTLERVALHTAFKNFEALKLEGGMLRTGGQVVAFTLGDPISEDTYNVHFEKAFGHMQGSFPLINREFARYVRETHGHIRYMNRENDMGVAGLRKAKDSYYPDLMVEKHVATQKEIQK